MRVYCQNSSFLTFFLKPGLSGLVSGVLLCGLLAVTGCGRGGEGKQKEIVIYAAASVTDLLEEAGALFTSRTGVKVGIEFASSGALARKIEAGAPADIFISADEQWIDYTDAKNLLVPGSKIQFAGNELVCIVPAAGQAVIANPGDLAGLERIAVGNPDNVPVGRYAREALTWYGIWDKLAEEQRLILTIDVRAALSYVEQAQVQAGIVYRTDALAAGNVNAAFSFPEESHKPVAYFAAAVAKRGNAKEAAEFLAFLGSKEFQAILIKFGFKLS